MSFDEINAPTAWRCVDFISDIHLQESEPANFLAWRSYLEHSPADAIFILGDLFEVWVGDDCLGSARDSSLIARHEGLHFEDRCSRVLHFSAQQHNLYFMHGNRDFLVGQGLAKACGMQILSDPSVLVFGGMRYLLSHGDALCLSDEKYQEFRRMVRSSDWQTQFLATPLQERMQQARVMRAASEARKKDMQTAGEPWIDIDQAFAKQWMDAAQAQHFIHGHTHEGRDHAISSSQGRGTRFVLPDWQAVNSRTEPARGYALRLSLDDDGLVNTHHIPVV
ncbi:UDP-2,3-diacylglucosamine diphosphatase [Variovorax sp. PCZ-1]|uniref:UDP-2,3-diacylglucosamine diphosphatase n=1 Tax=Variovorax sp. PCZ-1 TaxID=2835533 RepID=UPI001BCB33BC|nr:UDP-2,3-diacylglucosamine diphosphatase [Variovorax sp. PCZ-1]MBS7807698.1 UDP-2,3-diacylglucosamine diphosphatase [Variovorax sp. PCZ-1]